MDFVTIREFTASPKKIQSKLSANNELIITNNGKPTMLVMNIAGKDISDVMDRLNRSEAEDILRKYQMNSVRNGTDDISMEEIDAEIAAYRAEKKAI